jgi:hypothetical protein
MPSPLFFDVLNLSHISSIR